ncbi:MAG: formate/nitrite transporter family protein [Lachnospiraceae bacterium]|nr:formate/nitrite transporter family protein [Lachnospiraceae bacterium]
MDHFLSVKEAVNKYIAGCEAKIHTPTGQLFVKAVLAGMMIALGASGSSVAAHAIGNVGIARMAAATVFPVGLMMVILMGAELFTGDCLMVMAIADGRYAVTRLIKVLSIVYIGNFIGAILVAYGVGYSSQLDYSDGLLGAYTIKVALAKVNMSFGEAMISGVLCNVLVCFAVMMALCAKDITGKLLSSFFVIFLFVTEGFEHCVANMYYISAGLVAACNPQYVQVAIEQYGLNIEKLANLDISHFLMGNLIPVTIGNIIGGMLLVGIPLLYLNKEKTRKEQRVKEENNEYSMVFERSISGITN